MNEVRLEINRECWMCQTEMIVKKACGELKKKFITMLLCDAPGCGARKGYEKKED